MATIKDVAELAGVSISTVSNILNNRANVSEDKYQRVMKVINDLKYNPNFLASNLKTNKSRLVAIVLPELTDINRQVISVIFDTLAAHNYICITRLTHHNPIEENNALEELMLIGISGILLYTCNAGNHELFTRILNQKIPLVFFDSYPEGADYTSVLYDNRTLCRRLAEQIQKQHKGQPLAFVVGPQTYLNERDCLMGLKEGGLEGETIIVRLTSDLAFIDFWDAFINVSAQPAVIIATCPETAAAVRRASALTGTDITIYTLGGDAGTDGYMIPRNSLSLGCKAAELLMECIDSPVFFEQRRIVVKSTVEHCLQPYTVPARTESLPVKMLLFDGPTATALVKTFEAFYQRSGIKVEYERLDYSSLYERIAAGTDDADIFMLDYQWLDRLCNERFLTPLDPYFNDGFFDDYPPEILSLFYSQTDQASVTAARVYTLPVVVNVQLLFYRKDLFNDPMVKRQYYRRYGIELIPPRTWRDFEITSRFFTREFNPESPVLYGTTLQGMDPIFMAEEFFPRQWAYKGRILSSSGRVILDSTENERALTNLKAVWECTPKPERQVDWPIEARRLIDGDIAMQFTFSTHVPSTTSRTPGSINLGSIGIADAPGRQPMLGGWYLGVNHNSSFPAESASLINWLAGGEHALDHTMLGAFIPRTAVFENIRCRQLFPWIEFLQESIPFAGKREVLMGKSGSIDHSAVNRLLYDAIKKNFAGMAPGQALNEAQSDLEELLSK